MAEHADNLAIQTAGLTKVFRDFWGHQKVLAVDTLDLEVKRKEVFGLLGPNGSGKSTTIKMLLGLLFPSRGWAKVLGGDPGDIKINRHIGYLPEESHLYPFLNARETLDFYGKLFGLSGAERKVRTDSLLEMVGLAGVGKRPLGEFSKGMMRRIGLAQALINDPDLLILDEPTSGLDPIGTRQIKDLIIQLGKRGKTVLLCSHLLADVEDVCDRISILYGGKIQSEGRVDELLAHQDMTEIRTARLSESAIENIKNIIRAELPEGEFEVSIPRDRLEDYFLEIVTQAQASATATSGAKMGGKISDFLGSEKEEETDRGEVLLEKLVSGREEKFKTEKATKVEPKKPTKTVKTELIESLTAEKKDEELTTKIERVEPTKVETEGGREINKSLLDSLTGKKDQKQAGPEGENSDNSAS